MVLTPMASAASAEPDRTVAVTSCGRAPMLASPLPGALASARA